MWGVAYRPNKLRSQVQLTPDAARGLILDAFRKAGGDAVKAAASLDVSRRTFDRFVSDLGLAAELAAIREDAKGAAA